MHKDRASHVLKKAGLDQRETVVYLAGIATGKALASDIARKAGLSRTLTYHILGKLSEKGLVSTGGPKHGRSFLMEPVTRLQRMFERKRRELELMEHELEAISVELDSLQEQGNRPHVIFYEGIEGLKNIAQDILLCKEKELLVFVPSHKKIFGTLDRTFVQYWSRERDKRNIKTRSIYSGTVDWSDEIDAAISQSPLRQVRFAQGGVHFPAAIIIYDTKVATLTSAKESLAFVVESEEYACTMKVLFENMWGNALEPKK